MIFSLFSVALICLSSLSSLGNAAIVAPMKSSLATNRAFQAKRPARTFAKPVKAMMNKDFSTKNIPIKSPAFTEAFKTAATASSDQMLNLLKQDQRILVARFPLWDFTLLMRACANGNTPVARLLIDHGSEINAQDLNGNSALHHAVLGNHLDIVHLLLTNGADITLKGVQGKNALMISIEQQQFKITEALMDYARMTGELKALAHQQDATKNTLLHLIASNLNLKAFEMFLNAGADPLVINEDGFSAFDLAVLNYRADIVEYCLNITGTIPSGTDFQRLKLKANEQIRESKFDLSDLKKKMEQWNRMYNYWMSLPQGQRDDREVAELTKDMKFFKTEIRKMQSSINALKKINMMF